jgi:hypothetical protein
LYTDVSDSAPWRFTRVTHEQHLAAKGRWASPWYRIPGMRLELIFFDVMHIGALGIFRHLCASALWDLVAYGELHNLDPDVSLRQIWQRFRVWCREHRIPPPTGSLTRRSLGTQGHPRTHGESKLANAKRRNDGRGGLREACVRDCVTPAHKEGSLLAVGSRPDPLEPNNRFLAVSGSTPSVMTRPHVPIACLPSLRTRPRQRSSYLAKPSGDQTEVRIGWQFGFTLGLEDCTQVCIPIIFVTHRSLPLT